MNCIILAAGMNTRLDDGIPKSMLKVGNETLLERHLRAFTAVGIERFCVVTGYRHEMLEEFIGQLEDSIKTRITIAHNPRFDLANGLSLYEANNWVSENKIDDFYFTMADHYFSEDMIREVLVAEKPSTTLALVVDQPSETNTHIDLDDVTRVQSKHGLIDQIGKHISEYDYYDTGLFYARQEMFDYLKSSIDLGKDSISNMVQLLTEKQQASVLEISGHFWNDVDTPDDLEYMRSLI